MIRSGSVKPDDPPERIIVQHLDVTILVDAHRYAEQLVCIGDIAPMGYLPPYARAHNARA
jgi:hypothetical protein